MHRRRTDAFSPEALEARVLLSFSTASDDAGAPVVDAALNGTLIEGVGQLIQPGTEHIGHRFYVENDGAPGDVHIRTYLSLDQTKSSDDLLVYQSPSVNLLDGQRRYVPATSDDANFEMPELGAPFVGSFVYSIAEIVDSAGTVHQTLASEYPAYVHPTTPGRIQIASIPLQTAIDYALQWGESDDRSRRRSGVSLQQGFHLESATNSSDPSRIFAGSEVELSGTVPLVTRDESFVDRTITLTAALVGPDGTAEEIYSGSIDLEDAGSGSGLRRARGGVSEDARYINLNLREFAGTDSISLSDSFAAGLYTLRLSFTISGQSGAETTESYRPNVLITDGSTPEFWWEATSPRSSGTRDPIGPGFIDIDYSGEAVNSISFSVDPRDIGRSAEDRLENLLSEGRLKFALVPASAGGVWNSAHQFEINPAVLAGYYYADLSESGIFEEIFERRSDGGEFGSRLEFELDRLGNTVEIPAGSYRFAALITSTQAEFTSASVSASGTHSTDPASEAYSNNLFVSAESFDIDSPIAPGSIAPLGPADDFITSFRDQFGGGLSDGDSARNSLRNAVPEAAYSEADWTAENYWFQDRMGNVWSLWHGGAVHATDDGGHNWVLTNLSEAGGLLGQISFEPGSMSGVIASWRAFSIQGIADGQLVSLWWSPESGRQEWGNRANGWVLTPFDASVLRDADTGDTINSVPRFRGYTETQSNGRLTFDPRAAREARHGGMSIVLVDVNENVYVASFTTQRQAEGVGAPTRTNVWLLQPIDEVPGLQRLGLADRVDEFRGEYRTRSGRR